MSGEKLYFCTFFDSGYLSKGLALYRSLRERCESFQLVVFCMNPECFSTLQALNLPDLLPIPLEEVMNDELRRIRQERNLRSFLWTFTPFSVEYCLDVLKLPTVSYLDADLYFFADPGELVAELGNRSVSITPHFHDPEFDNSAATGKYCVQFLTFRNDERGRAVCKDWRTRCAEWCFDRMEDGKFGDQKYLDDWEKNFPGAVHVISHLGAGLAPWNFKKVSVEKQDGLLKLKRDGKNAGKLYFAHFHGLSDLSNGQTMLFGTPYLTTPSVIGMVYHSYVQALIEIELFLKKRGFKKFTYYVPFSRREYFVEPLREGKWLEAFDRLTRRSVRFVNAKRD